ncbi:MAG: hypothetical protein ACFFDR_12730 [Candidatus Thorarchaeota archaeon]
MNRSNDEEDKSRIVQDAVLGILLKYDKERASLRSILRTFRLETSYTLEIYSEIQYISMGIIQHLNTIDFILSRSTRRGSFGDISPRFRAMLRIALFQSRWQQISPERLIDLFADENSQMQSILKEAISKDLDQLIVRLPRNERTSLKLSHPSFIVDTLFSNMSESEALSLMDSNNSQGTAYLRRNRLRTTAVDPIDEISSIGVNLEQDRTVPGLFHVLSGMDLLVQSGPFLNSEVLIQDKASVLTVHALSPQPEEITWDACAAPGMKTQLIWEMMQQKGKLIATELNTKRLNIAKERSHALGTNTVEWMQGDASQCPITGANKILIDAPCSSTGMLRTHPSYKWRLNKRYLFSIMAIQNKILEGIISRYSLHPGTEIVYATCSILPHEGENQIDTILNKYDVELLDIPGIERAGYPDFDCTKKVRRLFPHSDNTDGFFIAKMRIKH